MLHWHYNTDDKSIVASWTVPDVVDHVFYVTYGWPSTEFTFAEIVKEMQVQVASFDHRQYLLQ